MRGIAASVLVFEGMVVFFATLVALDLSDVDHATLWWTGGTLAVACLLAAGFLVPALFVLGAVFAALWFLALHLGRKVARMQAAQPPADPPG